MGVSDGRVPFPNGDLLLYFSHQPAGRDARGGCLSRRRHEGIQRRNIEKNVAGA